MANYSITVNSLATSNTAPTLTGTVIFDRSKGQSISVKVNYITYKLFAGNLGLDESVSPNIWKLHFSSPLAIGVYPVEANVLDASVLENAGAATEIILATNSGGNLQITGPTAADLSRSVNNITIPQKVAIVANLLNEVNKLSGSGGVGGNPSVHPTVHDDITTGLPGRADRERDEDPRVKDKDKRQAANKLPLPPKQHPFNVVGAGGGGLGALSGLLSSAIGAASGAVSGLAAALGAPASLGDLAGIATGGSVFPSMGEAMDKLGTMAGDQASGGNDFGLGGLSANPGIQDQNAAALAAGAKPGQTATATIGGKSFIVV
jgi:hypothetical protein